MAAKRGPHIEFELRDSGLLEKRSHNRSLASAPDTLEGQMAEVTVKQFADTVGIPVDRLLTQLDAAGVKVADADWISDDRTGITISIDIRNGISNVGGSNREGQTSRIIHS